MSMKLIQRLLSLQTSKTRIVFPSLSYSTSSKYKLAEVGVLNEPLTDKYPTGQIFLHRLFGYRGVILFPWTACIFDKHDSSHSKIESSSSTLQADKKASEKLDETGPPAKSKANKLSYYQVGQMFEIWNFFI